MRKVYIKNLSPGMCTGREVMSKTGVVLLERGVRLTQLHISHLQNWGVYYVYIDEGGNGLLKRKTGNILSRDEFLKEYMEAINVIIDAFQYIRYFKEVPIMQIRELAEQRLVLLVDTIGALDYLFEIRSHSDYTFQHSLNVAIIAGILGKWHNYKGAELKNIILAGLLHDIGKLVIPVTVLDKPGKLSSSEFKVIMEHSLAGYQLVKDLDQIPAGCDKGILHHHERLDGSGYPFGIVGDEIHEYAKVVAIADIYEAMTADRPYRRRLTPLAALEVIAEQMYKKLDTQICLTFLENMRNCFAGNNVLLSNGQRAKIIVLNSGNRFWTKPIVWVQNGRLIDLQKEEEISIVELIEEV